MSGSLDISISQASMLTVGAFIDLAAMLTANGFVDDEQKDRAEAIVQEAVATLWYRMKRAALDEMEEAFCLCVALATIAAQVVELAHMSELHADIEGYERGDA